MKNNKITAALLLVGTISAIDLKFIDHDTLMMAALESQAEVKEFCPPEFPPEMCSAMGFDPPGVPEGGEGAPAVPNGDGANEAAAKALKEKKEAEAKAAAEKAAKEAADAKAEEEKQKLADEAAKKAAEEQAAEEEAKKKAEHQKAIEEATKKLEQQEKEAEESAERAAKKAADDLANKEKELADKQKAEKDSKKNGLKKTLVCDRDGNGDDEVCDNDTRVNPKIGLPMDHEKRKDDPENRPMSGSALYNKRDRLDEIPQPQNYDQSKDIAESGNPKLAKQIIEEQDKLVADETNKVDKSKDEAKKDNQKKLEKETKTQEEEDVTKINPTEQFRKIVESDPANENDGWRDPNREVIDQFAEKAENNRNAQRDRQNKEADLKRREMYAPDDEEKPVDPDSQRPLDDKKVIDTVKTDKNYADHAAPVVKKLTESSTGLGNGYYVGRQAPKSKETAAAVMARAAGVPDVVDDPTTVVPVEAAASASAPSDIVVVPVETKASSAVQKDELEDETFRF